MWLALTHPQPHILSRLHGAARRRFVAAPGRCWHPRLTRPAGALGNWNMEKPWGKGEGNYGKLLILVGNNPRAAEWCLFWNALLFCPRISSAIFIFNPDTVVTVSKWSKRTLPDMHPTQFQRGICILHDVAIPELEWTFSVFFQPRKPRKGTIEMCINGIYLLLHFHQSNATADLHGVIAKRPVGSSGCATALGSHLGDWRFPRKMCFSETTAKKMPLVKRTKTVVELFTYIDHI